VKFGFSFKNLRLYDEAANSFTTSSFVRLINSLKTVHKSFYELKIVINSASAASIAISSLVADDELSEEYIIPSVFDPLVAPEVAVAQAAMESGVSRKHVSVESIRHKTCQLSAIQVRSTAVTTS
jgi:malic enzyme